MITGLDVLICLALLIAYLDWRDELEEERAALAELLRRAVAYADRYMPDTERRRW